MDGNNFYANKVIWIDDTIYGVKKMLAYCVWMLDMRVFLYLDVHVQFVYVKFVYTLGTFV